MPGGGNGGALIGGAIVLVLLTMMTLDVFSGFWNTMMENKGPVVMVAIGLLIAWFSTRDEGASSGGAGPLGRPGPGAHGQHAAAPAPPHPSSASWMPPSSSGGGGGDGSTTSKRQQAGGGGSGPRGSNALSPLREHSASGKLGTLADTPPRRRRVQGNVKNGSAAGLVAVHASSSSSSLAGSTQDSGSGSTALVAVDEARSCTFMCTKPAGCGYRHACPDLGRRWMHCNKHGSHPLPPDGSVWREEVPEREAGGGSLRLCLAWDGTALDITALGACRGWDQEMTAAVCALLDSGRRVSGTCSQSPSFPMLHKWQEVAAMDYRAAARGRRLWSMFERWLANKNGGGSSRPLAIEMGRRA